MSATAGKPSFWQAAVSDGAIIAERRRAGSRVMSGVGMACAVAAAAS